MFDFHLILELFWSMLNFAHIIYWLRSFIIEYGGNKNRRKPNFLIYICHLPFAFDIFFVFTLKSKFSTIFQSF